MIIEVQHCVDCHLHNWCSRHNEAKYHDFYHKLEAKAKALLSHPRIIKNSPPSHYQPRNAAATTGLQVHHYFDEETQEEVVFPRHGAFEVKVNGILIFSKLQSNLWPNLEKISGLLAQMRVQVEAGRDISKFSLEFRQESNRQQLAETYKKLITFKINKRPHSSQFNATSYLPKGSVEQSPEPKQERFKRKNVTSLKKGGFDVHRKSDAARKPLIRFRNSKVEAANMYCEFPEAKNQDHCQLPEVGKTVKNEYCSPHSKKKIQFKNDALHPIRAQPFEIITNNGPALKLEKKPSRKLILKLNEKKSENSSHFTHKYSENFDEPSDPSDQVIMGPTPFFPEIPTKKSFKSLKSVMSIGDKLEARGHNEIKIEDYTEKQIQRTNSREGIQAQKVSVFQSISQTQKLVNQQAEPKKQPSEKKTQQHKFEAVEKHQSKKALVEQIQYLETLQPIQVEIDNNKPKQQRVPQQDIDKPTQDEEEEAYDQFEQPDEQARPETSSSRRMYHEDQAIREEEILEYQQAIEGNFRKKGNLTAEKVNQQDQDDEYPQEEAQEIPINMQDPLQEQLVQENYEDVILPVNEETEEVLDVPSKEQQVISAQHTLKLEGPAEEPEEVSEEFKLDEPQSFVLSQQGQQLVRVEKAEVEASISRMEQTLLNSIIWREPTVVDANLSNQAQLMDAVSIKHINDHITPEVSCQFERQQLEEPVKKQCHSQQPLNQLQFECKPQVAILEDVPNSNIIEEDDGIPTSHPQQLIKKEQSLQHAEEQHESAAEAVIIPEPALMVQKEQLIEEPSPKIIENELEDGLHQTHESPSKQYPQIESSPQDPPLKEESIKNYNPQQAPIESSIREDDSVIEQQREAVSNQPAKFEEEMEGIALKAKSDPEPICSVRQGLQEQPHPAERQAAMPSIHQFSDKESSRDPPTLRSIPNGTQSSIGLTNQIHSELNNVYQQIQARLDNRLDEEAEEEQQAIL